MSCEGTGIRTKDNGDRERSSSSPSQGMVSIISNHQKLSKGDTIFFLSVHRVQGSAQALTHTFNPLNCKRIHFYWCRSPVSGISLCKPQENTRFLNNDYVSQLASLPFSFRPMNAGQMQFPGFFCFLSGLNILRSSTESVIQPIN